VNSLEDRALVTNVGGGGKSETSDQSSAHIRDNVSVQVRHDQNHGLVYLGVGNHLQAGVVEKLGVELNLGEVLGDITSSGNEKSVGHLHDGGLVDNTDVMLSDALGVLESETEDTLGCLTGNELDGLDNSLDNLVLDSGVLSLGVLTD
jgi:hypothetical protein